MTDSNSVLALVLVEQRQPVDPFPRAKPVKMGVSIETGKPLDGDLPARSLRLIEEWCSLHQDELPANWERAERLEPLTPIDPLP